jgi:hypothetical protein
MSALRTGTARRALTMGAAASLLLALAACSPGGTDDPVLTPTISQPEETPAASDEPTETSEPAPPTVTVTAEPSEPPADAGVQLSGTGIGDVADGTPDSLPKLEALLGPADEVIESALAECGAPQIDSARWGSLWVSLDTGALFGWQVNSMEGLPDEVVMPDDLPLGTPMAEISALPGAGEVGFMDNYGVYTVDVDGVTWWFDDDSSTSLANLVGHNILGCG